MTKLRAWLAMGIHFKVCSSFLATIAISVSCVQNCYGNPEGGVVTAGQAQINHSLPNTVQVIQSSDKAVVNWDSFNVAQHERVEFQQPGSQSITLNRINPSNGVSQIYGSITANGQVWLMNPAGIWFAPGSHVNVGGLLATTAGINDVDFMAGKYHFLQSPEWNGSVINEGMIVVLNNGLAALVAPGAVNKGQIVATLGTAVLASSNEFTIDFTGDSLVTFAVGNDVSAYAKDQNGEYLKHAVDNSGSISANGGKIQIAAKTASKVLDNAINMSGIAVANSVSVKNGEIILSAGKGRVTVSGSVTASGKKSTEKGGVIKILGDEVALLSHALVDVSGDAGGGTILIGGNALGSGPEQNASYTYVGANVNVHADAKTHGDGGKVVVWSNLGTHFYGKIYARGGTESGNGGWVETSGKEYLQSVGHVTASAAKGKSGDWLLDPRDVTITTTTSNGAFDGGSPNIYSPTGNSSTVDAATIIASLNAGTNVEVNTGSTGTQAGNITVNSPITKSVGATSPTLTLNAAGAIAINAPIGFTSGGLGLILQSGGSITQTAGITASSLTANAGASAITLTNAANDFTGAVSLTNTGANNVAIRDANAIELGASSIGGTLSVTSDGSITQSGALTVTGATTLAAGATNNITLTDPGNDFSTIGVTTGLNVAVTDANDLTLSASTISGTLDINTSGMITQSGVLNVTGAATLAAGATNTIFLAADNNFSTIGVNSGNLAFIVNSNALNLSAFTVNILAVSANGAITQSGALNVSGIATLAAGASNNITLNNPGNTFGRLGISSGLNVELTTANSLLLGSSTVNGNFNLTTNGAITQSAGVTVNGVTTLSAGAANDITLTATTNDFNTVAVTSGNNVSLRDSNAIIIGATTAANSLMLTAGGEITQSGIIDTPILTAKTLGSNLAITLNSSLNKVNTIDLRSRNASDTANSGGEISYQDEDGFNIGNTIATTGTVSLIAGGNVTQNNGAGTGIFASTLTVLTKNDSGANINLENSLNNVTRIDLRSRNSTDTANAAGALVYTDLNAVSVLAANTTGTVNLIAGGEIRQTGTMTGSTLSAKTLLNTGAGIILNISEGNEFNIINLQSRNTTDTANAAGTIRYRSATGFDVAGIATTGILLLQNRNNVTNSPITQSGAIVAGETTLRGGATNDIILNHAGNDFGSVATSNGMNVILSDANDLILGASTISGTFNVNTNGTITQTDVITVAGLTTLASGSSNNITLNSANDFDTIRFTSGNNVAITDTNVVVLGASTVSGNLDVTAGGSISQSGALVVNGIPSFTVSAPASEINLASNENNFTMTPVFTTTGAGTISDLGFRNISATAALPALPSGLRNLTITFDNTGVNLPAIALTASGNLSVTANGTITQVGVLTVPGNASFNAGSGAITLLLNNIFSGAVSLTNTGLHDVAINAISNLSLAASTIGRKLTATTTGTLSLAGDLTANATGDSIILSAARFDNSGGYALNPGVNGRFLVWSSNANPFSGATPDNRSGISYDFKQYNATYGVTPILGSGNGFLYTLAPSVTPVLTGMIEKVYNNDVAANLVGHYSSIGAVDGDILNYNPSTGVYASANVGNNINVSVTGITISGASNGSATVYGYSLASTTANAFIGKITPATLTTAGITANDKVFDGNTQATLNFITSSLSGVYSGDTVSINTDGYIANFTSANVGNNVPIVVSGLGLSGLSANNYILTQPTGITANILPDGSFDSTQLSLLQNPYNLIFPMNLIDPVVDTPTESPPIEIIILNEPGYHS